MYVAQKCLRSTDQRTSQERHHYGDIATNMGVPLCSACVLVSTVMCCSCRAVVLLRSQRGGAKKVEPSTVFWCPAIVQEAIGAA